MTKLGTAYVEVRPEFTGFTRELTRGVDRGVDASMGGVKSSLSRMAGVATAALGSIAVGSFLKTTFSAVTDFQGRMNEVFTLLPGISGKAMGAMTEQVKGFATQFGVLPDSVIPALYQSLSAGVPKENVFAFLETAQKAAKGGVTDLTTAVDGISSVVNAYGKDVVSATKASDLMFTAVKVGKTTFGELSSALFNVTPAAAAAGVNLETVTAAISALTAQGVPTSVATTQIRTAIVELTQGAGKAGKAFTEVAGKSFPEFIKGGGTLQRALQLLEKEATKNGSSLLDMFGAVEGGQAALALTGKGTETFSKNLAEMAKAAGATDIAFAQMDQGIGPRLDKLKARFAVFSIGVGEALVPVVEKLLDFGAKVRTSLQPVLTAVATGFKALAAAFREGDVTSDGLVGVMERVGVVLLRIVELVKGNLRPILIGLGSVLAGVIVPMFAAWAVATVAAVAPLALLGAAVAGAVIAFERFPVVGQTAARAVAAVKVAFDRLGDAFAPLVEWVERILPQVSEAIGHVLGVTEGVVRSFIDVVSAVWRAWGDDVIAVVTRAFRFVQESVNNSLQVVSGIVRTVLAVINGDWGTAWQALQSVVSGVWDQIKNTISTAVAGLRSILGGIVSTFGEVLRPLGNLLHTWIVQPLEAIISTIAGMPGKIAEAAAGMFDGIKNAFRSAINWIIRAWNGLEFKIPGFDPPGPGPSFGGFTLGVPDIPQLAGGGRLRPGELGLVGERGAELIRGGAGGTQVFPHDALVAALKSASAAGSPSPAAGIHIDHLEVHGSADPDQSALATARELGTLAYLVGG